MSEQFREDLLTDEACEEYFVRLVRQLAEIMIRNGGDVDDLALYSSFKNMPDAVWDYVRIIRPGSESELDPVEEG